MKKQYIKLLFKNIPKYKVVDESHYIIANYTTKYCILRIYTSCKKLLLCIPKIIKELFGHSRKSRQHREQTERFGTMAGSPLSKTPTCSPMLRQYVRWRYVRAETYLFWLAAS